MFQMPLRTDLKQYTIHYYYYDDDCFYYYCCCL